MSERKEKQWAVLKVHPSGQIASIVWFDARRDARNYARARNSKGRVYHYRVHVMTRGPGG